MTTFRCEALEKEFDGIQALDNVSLQIIPETITAVIGPNGAGKTTLLNVFTGFMRPDHGRCFLGSHETTNCPPHRIAGLGIARTFQDIRLVQQLSVIENVLLAVPRQRREKLLPALFAFGGEDEETRTHDLAMQHLRLLGLDAKADDLANELSYGQQKLLTLGCCLATEAHTLLLDEPVAGIHPEVAGQILDFIRHLKEKGRTVLFVEHDIGAVRSIATTVIVMDQGKIIAQGPPEEILDRPEIVEAYLG